MYSTNNNFSKQILLGNKSTRSHTTLFPNKNSGNINISDFEKFQNVRQFGKDLKNKNNTKDLLKSNCFFKIDKNYENKENRSPNTNSIIEIVN